MTELLIGVTAFATGMLCGAAFVGPKVLATVHQMSHDLNPRGDSEIG